MKQIAGRLTVQNLGHQCHQRVEEESAVERGDPAPGGAYWEVCDSHLTFLPCPLMPPLASVGSPIATLFYFVCDVGYVNFLSLSLSILKSNKISIT